MGKDRYKHTVCLMTMEECGSYDDSCDSCDAVTEYEKQQRIAKKQQRIAKEEKVITFDREVKFPCNLRGITLKSNQVHTIAIIDEELLRLMKIKNSNRLSETLRGYGIDVMKQYPDFSLLKRKLNLGIPKKIFVDKDKIGLFYYDDVIYAVA